MTAVYENIDVINLTVGDTLVGNSSHAGVRPCIGLEYRVIMHTGFHPVLAIAKC